MNSTITINDRLEYAAESGAYATSLFVWGNTISWEKASMNIPDGPFVLEDMIRKLNAEQVPISTGNFLWLTAEAYNRKAAAEAKEAASGTEAQ